MKKNYLTRLILTAILSATGTASASMITLETGPSSKGPFKNADSYRQAVQAAIAKPADGFGSTALWTYDRITNQSLFGSSENIAYAYTINFSVSEAQAGKWEFRFGVDFGHGGAVFLDRVPMKFNSNDMWWNETYDDPAQYLHFTANMEPGNHVLHIYGIDACCDGVQQGQFNIVGAGFVTFSNADGLTPHEKSKSSMRGTKERTYVGE